jgi:dolichol-phosphate mannosyltransferase
MTAPKQPSVSIVIPVYNGERLVEPLLRSLMPELLATGRSFEIVLVDDGSPDASWPAIVLAAGAGSHVRGVKLSRNFGQQIAVSAGIARALGENVIVMDCDLQNPPSAIPAILAELDAGHDMVYTVSRARNNATDTITSRLFWFLLTRVLRVNIVKHQLMMRGMSSRFAQAYAAYKENTRTVAGIVSHIGFPYTVIEVENAPREIGKSNYNFFKRFNLMIEMIISITTAPLSILIYVSLFTFLCTTLIAIYYILISLAGLGLSGFTSIMIAIFFFGSLITLILGVIGLYLANIYVEVRRRPLYFVEKEV